MAEKKTRAARVGAQYEAKSKFYDYVSIPKFWYYKSDPGVKHDNKQCETCIFRSGDQSRQDQLSTRVCCDYLSITGHRRDCPPSPHCTKYVKGRRKVRENLFNPHGRNGFSSPDEPSFVELGDGYSK